MSLQREGRVDGEDLEQKWQLPSKPLLDGRSQHGLGSDSDRFEQAAAVAQPRGGLGVRADPELGLGLRRGETPEQLCQARP